MHHLKLMLQNPNLVKTANTIDRVYIKARLLNKLANICYEEVWARDQWPECVQDQYHESVAPSITVSTEATTIT